MTVDKYDVINTFPSPLFTDETHVNQIKSVDTFKFSADDKNDFRYSCMSGKSRGYIE
jgi:hypothetical protein